MRILMYGAGVIVSLYAALLADVGNDTSIYARGKRLEILKNNGLLYKKNKDLIKAKKKDIPNATFVVGDCENFPFENDSFDAIICSMSFHHYPAPQAFFDSVKRCLRPNGRLILRDVTSDNKVLVWLMNTLEMPLANICGHGDVRVPTRDVVMKCCRRAGLKVEKFEIRKGMRMHCVVRKQ